MASSGNPNQSGGSGGFDMQKLFKPSNPPNTSPNPNAPPVYGTAPSAPQFSPSYSSPQPPTIPNLQPGPFSYPPQTTPYHHYMHYPLDPLQNAHPPLRPPFSNSPLPPHAVFSPQHPQPTAPHIPSAAAPGPNPGARLMALLSTQTSGGDPLASAPTNLELSHPPMASSSEAYSQLPASIPVIPMMPTAPPISLAAPSPVAAPGLLPSSKLPRGRHINGDHAIYDVDNRRPGEVQPQLEVNPITKYGSDPGLVIGRQIAVNGTYICYGLKFGQIRVLNINTALRHLLRGHSQRVTDMAFFAEDVHILASASVDGKVFIWKITEGLDEEGKPQITAKIVQAVQIVGDRDLFHPRVCWHTHKQEVLMVGIGNHVLRIDTTKVAKGDAFSEEEPIKCPLEKPIDGIYVVGKHDGDVTDLSICQWMTSRLASASTDGTVKIWGERKSAPLTTLRPHDGQPVNSVTFLVAPQRPDHIVLLTAGPLSHELKIWASTSQEGWLLPSEVESWQCMQTLELKSSSEPRLENAFFNQVVVLPRVGLVLLANAKKNAIYAVHVEYGPNPLATCMDYIAEFTVTMPILSLTGTSECISEGECIVQIYCVQTQAIQQYALDLFLCLPPPMDLAPSDLSASRALDISTSDGFTVTESPQENLVNDTVVGNARPKSPFLQESSESASTGMQAGLSSPLEVSELVISRVESKPNVLISATSDGNNVCIQSPPLPLSPRLSGRLSGPRSPPKSSEQRPPSAEGIGDQMVNNYVVNRKVETVHVNLSDIPSLNDNYGNETMKQNNLPEIPNSSVTFDLSSSPAHLITPSEILSMAVSSENTLAAQDSKMGETVVQDVGINNEAENVVVDVKVVGEGGVIQLEESESKREARILVEDKREKAFYSQASDISRDISRECCPSPYEIFGLDDARQVEHAAVSDEREQPSDVLEEEVQDGTKDTPGRVTESAMESSITQSPSVVAKGKKNKVKSSHASASSSTTASLFNSTDSLSGQPGSSSSVPAEFYAQILAMQDLVNQVITVQKEMQKQMATMVAVPVSKEGKRIEAALGRNMDRLIKSNVDAIWVRLLEENEKREKVERDRLQQITNLVSNIMSKDMSAMIDKMKKEIAAIGPTVTKNIISVLEKTMPSAIADSFQKGFSDKAVNQLEKSLCSKLETTLSRQLQTQFQTSVKQALHDGVRSTIESSLIPAFELSCKAMFEQIDSTCQKGMTEYIAAVQQQFESTNSSLALTLRDGINSLSSAVQILNTDVADGLRKIHAFACARAYPIMDPMSNSSLSNGPQQVEVPLDPTKELTRLISDHKFEEAFTAALQRTDLSLVSWLCSQVDLQSLLSTVPLPLSQGVLLSLVQQLACDLGNGTSQKLSWVTEVAMALNPSDPMIIMHARPILEQVYQMLVRQRTVSIASGEANSIRMVIHVVTSILKTCK